MSFAEGARETYTHPGRHSQRVKVCVVCAKTFAHPGSRASQPPCKLNSLCNVNEKHAPSPPVSFFPPTHTPTASSFLLFRICYRGAPPPAGIDNEMVPQRLASALIKTCKMRGSLSVKLDRDRKKATRVVSCVGKTGGTLGGLVCY